MLLEISWLETDGISGEKTSQKQRIKIGKN